VGEVDQLGELEPIERSAQITQLIACRNAIPAGKFEHGRAELLKGRPLAPIRSITAFQGFRRLMT
jgi:hypothetical protein